VQITARPTKTCHPSNLLGHHKQIEKYRKPSKNLEFSAKASTSVEGQRQTIKKYGRESKVCDKRKPLFKG